MSKTPAPYHVGKSFRLEGEPRRVTIKVLNEGAIPSVEKICARFLARLAQGNRLSRKEQAKQKSKLLKSIQEVQTSIARLQATLDQTDEEIRDWLEFTLDFVQGQEVQIESLSADFLTALDELEKNLLLETKSTKPDSRKESVEGKKGRPPDYIGRNFINRLALLYREVRGKDPGREDSDFGKLVRILAKAVDAPSEYDGIIKAKRLLRPLSGDELKKARADILEKSEPPKNDGKTTR